MELGYSMSCAASEANISSPYLSKIETGTSQPSPLILDDLGRVLGFSFDDVRLFYLRVEEAEMEQEISALEKQLEEMGIPTEGAYRILRPPTRVIPFINDFWSGI